METKITRSTLLIDASAAMTTTVAATSRIVWIEIRTPTSRR
jgi:hypothetical protein